MADISDLPMLHDIDVERRLSGFKALIHFRRSGRPS